MCNECVSISNFFFLFFGDENENSKKKIFSYTTPWNPKKKVWLTHPGPPLEPQLEDVVVSAALYDLVPRVVADVVALVRLEEIVGGHLVTTDEKSLHIQTSNSPRALNVFGTFQEFN